MYHKIQFVVSNYLDNINNDLIITIQDYTEKSHAIYETSATEYSIQRTVPEPRKLVKIRKHQWIVAKNDWRDSASSDSSNYNLVPLTSISEDSLGEDINVIWEIEPGAQIVEKSGLPDMSMTYPVSATR